MAKTKLSEPFHIEERDEAGKVLRRYTDDGKNVFSKEPRSQKTTGLLHVLANLFLPAGYPTSVTPDYVEYQIYDGIQCFASTIAALLAARAALQGVGVGRADASATYAVLLTTVQDAVGKLASIPFAGFFGTALEPEAKRYRLIADVLYDTAMALDCVSPHCTPAFRIPILSLSAALKAITGVAAGGAGTALNVHFAKHGNVAELNAKNTGQKTAVGLMGMVVGSFIVSHITTPVEIWLSLICLFTLHIATNYLGVKTIVFRMLNRQRANLVWATFRDQQHILTPSEAAQKEQIFDTAGGLRDSRGRHLVKTCEIGAELQSIRSLIMASPGATVSSFRTVFDAFENERYMLWFKPIPHPVICICLKSHANAADQLKAWAHAYDLARSVELSCEQQNPSFSEAMNHVDSTLHAMNEVFPGLVAKLRGAGWDLEKTFLITGSSTILALVDPQPES